MFPQNNGVHFPQNILLDDIHQTEMTNDSHSKQIAAVHKAVSVPTMLRTDAVQNVGIKSLSRL